MLTFQFSEAEANYILAVLVEKPHREVRALVDNIVAQAKPQLPAPEPQPTEAAA